ncbi:MAG: DoxX family membrane protein [Bacteroidales bacterium]|nr:DoxX family membrane protein [Bacteroidales bacterium]
MKVVRRAFGVLLGFVFFSAGFLKLMDPVGAGLSMEAYLHFFRLDFLREAAKALAVTAAMGETLLGAALLTGVWRKTVGVLTACVLAAFTLLTAILWMGNPAMDCGCFGEAIHLTHTQTFLKNLVLCGLWALAFLPLRATGTCKRIKYAGFGLAAVSVCLFCLYSLLSIPMVDFTAFRPGNELLRPDGDTLQAEGAPLLSFCDAAQNYADERATDGKVLIVSVYDTGRMTAAAWERIATLFEKAQEADLTPLLLLAGSVEEADAIGNPVLQSCCYFADRRSLMGLNRSNGGATYVDNGLIVAKWAARALPDRGRLQALAGQDAAAALIDGNTPSRLRLQGFLLYVFAVMLLL